MSANTNPLELLATLVFIFSAINLTVNGDNQLAIASFFVSFCSLLQLERLFVVFWLYYVLLFIMMWQKTSVTYLLLGSSLAFMYT